TQTRECRTKEEAGNPMSKRIPLTQGYFATIDDEDFDLVNRFKWFAYVDRPGPKQRVYARRNINLSNGKRGIQMMHGLILGVIGVDHRDGDGLNNQRYNLRKATEAQNQANVGKRGGTSSRFKGVSRAS